MRGHQNWPPGIFVMAEAALCCPAQPQNPGTAALHQAVHLEAEREWTEQDCTSPFWSLCHSRHCSALYIYVWEETGKGANQGQGWLPGKLATRLLLLSTGDVIYDSSSGSNSSGGLSFPFPHPYLFLFPMSTVVSISPFFSPMSSLCLWNVFPMGVWFPPNTSLKSPVCPDHNHLLNLSVRPGF